jgi:hypothetical protein
MESARDYWSPLATTSTDDNRPRQVSNSDSVPSCEFQAMSPNLQSLVDQYRQFGTIPAVN